MKKTHICLIDYDMCDWGGVEQVIENMGLALMDDYKVSMISLCTGFLKTYPGIDCHTIINRKVRVRGILLKGYFKLIRTINRNHMDIVVVCGSCAGIIVTLARPFIKAKIIFADHLNLMGFWDNKPIRHLLYWNSKIADYTVTLTKKNRNDYIKYFHISPQKICYIYNWINEQTFELVQEYQRDTKKIMTAGRLEYEKGYDRLIDIAKQVLPQHPDWEWHIYGKGKLYKVIDRKIRDNKLERQLILKGMSNELLEEYHNYAIFALTSYIEGLPLVLLEAKVNHVPSISFNILTGPSEIINDGYNGYLIQDGDISSFAEKLGILMESDDLRYTFSCHTCEGIDKFRKNEILKQWKALFSKLLS